MIGHRKRIKMAMSGRSYELYASSTAIVGIIYSNKKPNCKRFGRKKDQNLAEAARQENQK